MAEYADGYSDGSAQARLTTSLPTSRDQARIRQNTARKAEGRRFDPGPSHRS